MRATRVRGTAVAILVGAVLCPAAAMAHGGAADDHVVLRRDSDRAVPVDPVIGAGAQTMLRRDGSHAAPFVPNVGPSIGARPDGLQRRDAAIGAAAALALTLLASAAAVAAYRQRSRSANAQPLSPCSRAMLDPK